MEPSSRSFAASELSSETFDLRFRAFARFFGRIALFCKRITLLFEGRNEIFAVNAGRDAEIGRAADIDFAKPSAEDLRAHAIAVRRLDPDESAFRQAPKDLPAYANRISRTRRFDVEDHELIDSELVVTWGRNLVVFAPNGRDDFEREGRDTLLPRLDHIDVFGTDLKAGNDIQIGSHVAGRLVLSPIDELIRTDEKSATFRFGPTTRELPEEERDRSMPSVFPTMLSRCRQRARALERRRISSITPTHRRRTAHVVSCACRSRRDDYAGPMLKRLLIGWIKGLAIGGALGAGIQYGLPALG